MPRFRNAVGPKIAEYRTALGLTQEQFAARLQILGLSSIDRVGVVKIETRIRSVFDFELKIIADALKIESDSLFPDGPQLRRDLPYLRAGQRTLKRGPTKGDRD